MSRSFAKLWLMGGGVTLVALLSMGCAGSDDETNTPSEAEDEIKSGALSCGSDDKCKIGTAVLHCLDRRCSPVARSPAVNELQLSCAPQHGDVQTLAVMRQLLPRPRRYCAYLPTSRGNLTNQAKRDPDHRAGHPDAAARCQSAYFAFAYASNRQQRPHRRRSPSLRAISQTAPTKWVRFGRPPT